MRKTEIIAIVCIAIAVGFIFAFSSNSNTYGTFKEAFASPSSSFTVVGELNKTIGVESPQANLVIFNLKDKNGEERKVYLNQTVPEHFDRTDKVVITGKANVEKSAFMATQVQLKCPSKYNDEASI